VGGAGQGDPGGAAARAGAARPGDLLARPGGDPLHLDALGAHREQLPDDPAAGGRAARPRGPGADRPRAPAGDRGVPARAGGRAAGGDGAPLRRIARVVLFLLALLAPRVLPAAAQVAPDARWRSFSTEHFHVT